MPATTIAEALNTATASLAAAGIAGARHEASALLAEVYGCDRLALLRQSAEPIAADRARDYDDLLRRRRGGEPLSRIRRRREFWSLELEIGPAVLDPRPDSEALVAAVLEQVPGRDAALRLLDLGTGSGCLLLALLSELPAARGLGVDRDPAAVALAQCNARRLGLAARAGFLAGDWLSAIDAEMDVIVCNPPYVRRDAIAALAREVREHEPVAALDGGVDGLDAYRALIPGLAARLVSGGLAAFEVGAGQAAAVAAMFTQAGFAEVRVRADLAGIPRCVLARG